jgi:hypothetical protein
MSILSIPFVDELAALRRDIHAHPELAFGNRVPSDIPFLADLVARELERYGCAPRGRSWQLRGYGCRRYPAQGPAAAAASGFAPTWTRCRCTRRTTFRTARAIPGRCTPAGTTVTRRSSSARRATWLRTGMSWTIDGCVYFIFQPAEESEGGAAVMISDGLFDRFPMACVFGLHNWPGLPVGQMAVMPGPVMAGTCAFEIAVRGHGCHAAMPQQGVDTLVAASQLVLALQTVVARNRASLRSRQWSASRRCTPARPGTSSRTMPSCAARSAASRQRSRNSSNAPSSVSAVASRAPSGRRSRFASTTAIRRRSIVAAESEVCRRVASAAAWAGQGTHQRAAVDGRGRLRLHAAREARVLRLARQWSGYGWLYAAQSALRFQRRHPAAGCELLGAGWRKPCWQEPGTETSAEDAGRAFLLHSAVDGHHANALGSRVELAEGRCAGAVRAQQKCAKKWRGAPGAVFRCSPSSGRSRNSKTIKGEQRAQFRSGLTETLRRGQEPQMPCAFSLPKTTESLPMVLCRSLRQGGYAIDCAYNGIDADTALMTNTTTIC